MDGIGSLFSRFGNLPCAFLLRTDKETLRLGEGEPAFELHVRNGQGTKALQSLDELAIAEAYVRGDLEIEGDAVRAMWFRNLLSDNRLWIKTWRRLQPLLLGRERLNPEWIAKHYDSGNIQLLFIDRDYRAYTPGLFESEDDTLETSTRRKYDFAFEQLRLKEGDEVLDVGHGWGGFLQYCCSRGVRGQGITLSKDQFGYVTNLIRERGLDAQVLYQDFFTYQPGRRFDAISMMGVIEDLSDYPRVMQHLAELVKPGGRIYLDFASGKVPFGTSSFITKYVWPGTFRMTYMPQLMEAIDQSSIQLVGVWNDRRNYHLWAKHGHQRWVENKDEVLRRASEETWRLFRLLLAGTAGVMNDPAWKVTAYRMVLELPAE
ncbi:MAG TPA: class I SAM-dependent methyltransferase [Thermoanaerobaculia bacterium]|nr:class I SAM-dependent methyltransferase [Thermoanaerobaculia bacterium]